MYQILNQVSSLIHDQTHGYIHNPQI